MTSAGPGTASRRVAPKRLFATAATSLLLTVVACSDAVQPSVPAPKTVVSSADSVAFVSLGAVRQMSATVLDQTGTVMTGATLSWRSSTTSVATVSATGLVTAVGNGTTSVAVTAGGVSDTFVVTVSQIATSVAVSAPQVDLAALTDTLRLTATAHDVGGSPILGATIAWSVVDTLVATVSTSGLVRATANGTTSVLATAGGAVGTASVRVAQLPASVVLSADSLVFASLGDTVRVVATVTDGRGFDVPGGVVWASSSGSIATAVGGLVTAVGNGATVVTATAGVRVDTLRVRVQQVPASIVLAPDSVVLSAPGDSALVQVSVYDARGVPIAAPSISWSSNDNGVATVSPAGRMLAVATGATTVAATAGGGVTRQASVRVVPQLTLVAASATTVSAQVATGVSLSVQVRDLLGVPFQGATVTWATDAGSGAISSPATTPSGATGHAGAVWQLGTLAGAQRATARITSRGNVIEVAFVATALPGPAVNATLVADSILLSARGETAYLSPTYRDQYANITSAGALTWTSRAPSVASVAADGLVTGQAAGATWVVASHATPTDSILVTVVMRGAITITFDDGFRTVYDNAWPLLDPLDLPANVAVNPAQVGFPAYMTKAHLDELHAAGWSIVSHSMTHDTLTSLTVGELEYELRGSQEWIDAQGYNGSNVFIVPFHLWSARERDAIGMYYEAARGTSANSVVPDSLVAWRPTNPYALTGIEADQLPYTTPQGRDRLRALLTRATTEGAFLDVFFHNIPPGNVVALQETLLVLNDFRARVLPYHRLYPRFARAVF